MDNKHVIQLPDVFPPFTSCSYVGVGVNSIITVLDTTYTRHPSDNQDCTLRFRQDAHGSTFPCGPYAHGSTFQTTNMTTCTRSAHTISRRVHMSKCSTYFASHISPWSRCHLLAGNNADHCTVARLHFFSKRFVLSECFFATDRDFHLFAISFFLKSLQPFFHRERKH